jgi:hypothetical protein
VPTSEWDTLEARVEVLDSTGMVIASTSQKTFFPTAWTDVQVQQAIYAAFIEAFQGGDGPLGWMAGTTSAGVVIELVVNLECAVFADRSSGAVELAKGLGP